MHTVPFECGESTDQVEPSIAGLRAESKVVISTNAAESWNEQLRLVVQS